ncbi:MAG: hypothetical protein LKJ94_05285 [Candidatus Methanomethylophilus sp.]|jgi:ribosomal protein L37E|nr:hypothetical protein [Methanomethylophilus sp.]MCI2075097.1 hypothetical protein [Methanomethylophilus sp.]MCI2092439.1 hypothetical protein [Methanomethylophilus sp.]
MTLCNGDDGWSGMGMWLFPPLFYRYGNGASKNEKDEAAAKVMCPVCGALNAYPYRYCSECGSPSPMEKYASSARAEDRRFSFCPFCGGDIRGLSKPPRYCPYCDERFF